MESLLHELHKQGGAEFQQYDDVEIVATFGEPQAEYAAIRKSIALLDLPQRAVLEVTGKDRLTFLNNLITNQTYDKATKTGIQAGTGVYAFLLNAKSGRIISDMNVLEQGERTLLEMDRRMIKSVKETLENYRFAEQVRISELQDVYEIALQGPQVAGLIEGLGGLDVLCSKPIEIYGINCVAWRDDPAGVPGYYLLVPNSGINFVWSECLKVSAILTDNKRKSRPTGWAAFNAARIEAGRPLFGIDFDQTILPAETAQMSRAVSFTKGCYPGQEIVARMHARQVVSKQIAGLKFTDDALPIAGAEITDDQGNIVGGVTSSTISPMLSNTAVAIALLKRPHFAIGTVLNVPAEGAMRKAVVTQLPFLNRSLPGVKDV